MEELDQEDQFEDFTNVSNWEIFTSNLEQVLRDWQARTLINNYPKLNDEENEPKSNLNDWIIQTEKLCFPPDELYQLAYFKKIENEQNCNDQKLNSEEAQLPPYLQSINEEIEGFPPPPFNPTIISDYYNNISEYAILSQYSVNEELPITDESKLKILLSSMCIAMNNVNINYPLFVQFHHPKENYFSGLGECSGIRTSFDMIRLRNTQNKNNFFLSSLLEIFKSKAKIRMGQNIQINAHFFYNLYVISNENPYDNNIISNFDLWEILDKNEEKSCFDLIKFGLAKYDPIKSIDLVTAWIKLSGDVVVDRNDYSDLDPLSAPEWYIRFNGRSKDDMDSSGGGFFYLSDLINKFKNLEYDRRNLEDILGQKCFKSLTGWNENESTKFTNALSRLTDPGHVERLTKVTDVIKRATRQRLPNLKEEYENLQALNGSQIDSLVSYLFPDAEESSKHFKYPQEFKCSIPKEFQNIENEEDKDFVNSIIESYSHGLKSSPIDSLVFRLSVLSAIVNYHESSSALAQLWAEFILELRYRWQNSFLICGLEKEFPNTGSCLLNQKLQMLNCCIDKKIQREEKSNNVTEENNAENIINADEEDDDDEFFDCQEGGGSDEEGGSNKKIPAKLLKPMGRLRKCGNLRLLETGEFLYIPITQDPAPLTEDNLAEQEKILEELGNSNEGSEQRAKLMCVHLHSDMQSFKAANPGATLGDFVRWYSPRDWIDSEEGEQQGTLSPRMKLPNNLWVETWNEAVPVPARLQKRLFDDTMEAEKILHWLATRSVNEICQLLIPTFFHFSLLKIAESLIKSKFKTDKISQTLIKEINQYSRNQDDLNKSHIKSIIKSIEKIEQEYSQLNSIIEKFPDLDTESISLVEGSNKGTPPRSLYIKISENGVKTKSCDLITNLFYQEAVASGTLIPTDIENFRFSAPLKKVFVIKQCGNGGDGDIPQRMACLLRENEFLLAGTFSTRTD